MSHIRIGDDSTEYSINNSIIVENITDSGFFEASLLLSGRFLTIRRNQSPYLSIPFYNYMNLHTVKAYQTPNLVKLYESKISITTDTSPSVSGSEAINLITNLEHRSSNSDQYAITVSDPWTRLTDKSCFEVDYTTIKSQGNKMIIGFDFTESVFIHAVLHTQSEGSLPYSSSYGPSSLKHFYQNYEVYIGDHSIYSYNQKCAGGPFLDPSNPTTFKLDWRAFYYAEDPFSVGQGMVWPFGKENWCNLEGRYLFMVADMSQQVSSAADSDKVSVCSLGVSAPGISGTVSRYQLLLK